MRRRLLLASASFCFFAPAFLAAADRLELSPTDWPWWRGPSRDGVAASDQDPPRTWSETENVLWKASVPGRGHGSPTVVGQQVFLATADEQQNIQSVLCYDRGTGKLLWQREVHRGQLHPKNKKASQASATVACDGERLFISFLNNNAVYTTALTRDGKQLWQRKVSDYVVHQGYGSSPAIYQSLVIVAADNKGGGAIVAFDRATGQEAWRHDRPKTPNYASPVILPTSGRDQLLLSGCDRVSGFDPLTGARLWEIDGATTECVTSSVTDGKLVFTSGGYPRNHVSAVRTDGSGETLWQTNVRVYVPSMLVRNGYLYAIADAGIAQCWKSDSGDSVWRQRLRGTFSASPVMVGNLVYATNEEGVTFVLKATPEKCEIIAENQLGDEVFATPAICDSRVYLRVAHYEGEARRETLYSVGSRE